MGRELASAMARWWHLARSTSTPSWSVLRPERHPTQWLAERIPSVRQSTADYRALLANPEVEPLLRRSARPPPGALWRGHRRGQAPARREAFGIDRAANDAILACAAGHPLQIVRCSSEMRSSRRPAHPAMAEAGAFGRVIEVNTGFLHSSDSTRTSPQLEAPHRGQR